MTCVQVRRTRTKTNKWACTKRTETQETEGTQEDMLVT